MLKIINSDKVSPTNVEQMQEKMEKWNVAHKAECCADGKLGKLVSHVIPIFCPFCSISYRF